MHKHWKARVAAALVAAAAAIVIPLRMAATAPAATCSPALQSVTLAPASVPGGASSTVTANLNCVTSKALAVRLRGFSGVTVPASLTVAAGHASGSAAIKTAATKTARKGWIVGTLGKVSHERLLTVAVTPKTCASPSLKELYLYSLTYVGDHPVLWVAINCYAGAPVRVSLKSTSAYLLVPVTATISKYYTSVYVQLTPKAYAAGAYKATISVHYASKTLSTPLTVFPGLSRIWATSSNDGHDSVDFAVELTGKAPQSQSLDMTKPVELWFPDTSITVPAGTTVGHLAGIADDIPAPLTLTLSATLGHRTLRTTVTILPPVFGSRASMTILSGVFNENTYILIPSGTDGVSAWVVLSEPAPPDGVAVTITAGDPAVHGTGTITIPAGQRSKELMLGADRVTTLVNTTLTATADGVTATMPVVIQP